jgi:hypothetical protein
MGYNFHRMAGRSSDRAKYTIACSCGANHTLDARSFGKPRPCRCGATVTVAWGRDPRTYKTVPVAMVKANAPPAAPKGSTSAFCTCGYSRPLAPGEKNPSLRCPTCGSLMAVDNRKPGVTQKVHGGTKTSAPLLPLHVKVPLKTEIKKGAPFFICACGMRILIRAGMEGTRIQCPECDQFHMLEIESPAAPPPPAQRQTRPARAAAPEPPPKAPIPAAAPPPSKPLGLGEFLCECGEVQPPRTSRTGREFVCKKCGRKGRVETDKDPQTGLPRMRPVFTSGPMAAPAPVPAPVPRPAATPPSVGEVSFEELEPVEASFVEAAGPGVDDAPPNVDADAQIVPCGCGAEILFSATDIGHTIQCPACSDKMVVEGSRDAKTGKTSITLRIVGELDDPDWKLEEFQ